MYNISSPGNRRPVYERNGMRFDLADTDPQINGGWRFELMDTFRAEASGVTHNYHMAFMFPDDFKETTRFIICQFKHGVPSPGHSPPVSLKVENDRMFWTFRTAPTGWDQNEDEDGHIRIQRNRWYEYNLSVRWSHNPADHPFFLAKCDDVTVVERMNTPNMYNFDGGGIRHRVGLYIWSFPSGTQHIYARL